MQCSFIIISYQEFCLVLVLFLQRLLAKLTNKEKEASKLAEHLDFEKVWTNALVYVCCHNIQPYTPVRFSWKSSSHSAFLLRTKQRQQRSFPESCSQPATIWNLSWTEWKLKRSIWLLRFRSVNIKCNKTVRCTPLVFTQLLAEKETLWHFQSVRTQ